jgi:hypothetical protein
MASINTPKKDSTNPTHPAPCKSPRTTDRAVASLFVPKEFLEYYAALLRANCITLRRWEDLDKLLVEWYLVE